MGMKKPLVANVEVYGRAVNVTTYHDGKTPVVGRLMFETETDAWAFGNYIIKGDAHVELPERPEFYAGIIANVRRGNWDSKQINALCAAVESILPEGIRAELATDDRSRSDD